MANNVQAEAVVSAGVRFVTAEVTAYGDASSHVPGCFLGIVSGAEGSQTFTEYVGGAGSVTAGTQRVTLASDDPAVVDLAAMEVLLGTIDADTGGILTAVQLIDDAVYTDGSGTPSKGIAVMGTDGTNPQLLSVNASGHLNIADGGNAITVDGTVAATQSGSWTVDLGATDNAVLDAIAASLAGTLTVGSHAVTNAGTFPVQIDGAALTALQLIDNPVFADDAAFTLASSSVMMAGAIRDDSLSTLTAVEGDAVPLRVSSTGALHVTGAGGGTQYNVDDVAGATDTGTLLLAIRDDSLATLTPADGDYVGLRVSSTGALHVTGGGGGTEYNEDAATPATITGTATMMERDDALSALTPIEGDWAAMRCSANGALWVAVDGTLAATQSGTWNITNVSGTVSLPTGASTSANQTTIIGHLDGVEGLLTTIDADTGSILTAVQLVDDVIFADDAAFTLASSKVAMAGAIRDNALAAALTAAEGDAVPLRVTQEGGLWVTPTGSASGGLSTFRSIDLDESEEEVKATAGTVYTLTVFNSTATILYLKLYNATAANVTVGTTTPQNTFVIPANSTSGAGFVINIDKGIEFSTAITAAVTTGVADNDTGAPAANAAIVNIFYK